MTVPSIIPPKTDALLKVKYAASQQLLDQYIALEKLREHQISLLNAFIHRQAKWITCLLPMLVASVIVNLYLVYRFF